MKNATIPIKSIMNVQTYFSHDSINHPNPAIKLKQLQTEFCLHSWIVQQK